MKTEEQIQAEIKVLRGIAAHPDTELLYARLASIVESALIWALSSVDIKPPHKELPIAAFILRGDLPQTNQTQTGKL